MNEPAARHRFAGFRMQNLNCVAAALLLSLGCGLLACHGGRAESGKQPEPNVKPEKTERVAGFGMRHNLDADGKAKPGPLRESADWHVADFYGKGAVRVENCILHLDKGNDMTGVTWRGPLIRMNYEVSLEAMRDEGEDFFCGLTFPVNADPCSLILGGWGGSVVGLSSIDYGDAANNMTTRTIEFTNKQWYHVRVRVYGEKIEAWLDDRKIVDVVTTNHRIGIRWEIEPCVPMGIATWQTAGAIRNIELRALTEQPLDYEVKK